MKRSDFNFAVVFFTLAFISLLIMKVDISQHWLALIYLTVLLLLTLMPALVILTRRVHPWLVTLALTPVLLVSLDTFFLRLGIYNYFIYVENTWHPAINQEFMKKAAGLVLLGNFALWVGYGIRLFEQAGNRLRVEVAKWSDGNFSFSETNLWLLYFIGLVARFYILRNSLGGYFSFDAQAQTKALSYVQYIGLIENLCALCVVVYFVVLLEQGKKANWRPFFLMLGIELVTVFLMGFKGQVIFRLVYLTLAYTYFRKTFPLKIVIFGTALLMIIMPVNLLMRDQYTQGSSHIVQGQASSILLGTVSAIKQVWSGSTEYTVSSAPERFVRQSAQMQDFTMAVQYVDRTGDTLHGLDFKNFFYSFIPRAIWPTKPIASLGGWFNSEVYGYGNTSAAAITVPGDFYLNFGWLGVPIGFLLYGGLLRLVKAVFIDQKPRVRIASIIPFIILGLGMPSSELGSQLAEVARMLFLYFLVLSFILFPRLPKGYQLSESLVSLNKNNLPKDTPVI